MKQVILISAKARGGKDTFAEMLRDQLEAKGSKVVVDHFAKYIKNLLKEYYGWDGITKNKEMREKLQWLGTERIKEDLNYKCFHAKRLSEDFQIVQEDFDYFLVSDTRFKDEIFIMKAMFPNQVMTIRIQRDDFTGGLTEEQLKHKSEIDLDDFQFDLKIQNNGTLEDLENKVETIIQHYNL